MGEFNKIDLNFLNDSIYNDLGDKTKDNIYGKTKEKGKIDFKGFFTRVGRKFKSFGRNFVLAAKDKETYVAMLSSVKKFFKLFISNKKAVTGTIILGVFILIAIFGRSIFPYNPMINKDNQFLKPSWAHWLGTDESGRDTFRMLVHGTRDILIVALLTAAITVVFGVTIGLVAGLNGGNIVDKTLSVITNVFLSIPSFPILIILASFLTVKDSLSFALILSIFNWAGLSRAVRSQVISIKERDYIEICHVMGLSKTHIITKEIVPNISSYILVNFILIMRNAIIGSVGIMTLGVVAFEPTNWGAILLRVKDSGAIYLTKGLWFVFSPIIAIMIFQIGIILLSNGLDEALNPRLRRE